MDNAYHYVRNIFSAALKAVDPYGAVKKYSGFIRSRYIESGAGRCVVVGFGKAGCTMAMAMEDSLQDIITGGIVITKYGYTPASYRPAKIRVFEGGHPVPDENGVNGTRAIIELLAGTDESTMVVCLISGGGSALLVSPYSGITLDEKQTVTRLLLRAGADIDELNTVRKHISEVKGGRLAELAYPSEVVSLVLSDVIGDKLSVIASGPTSPDPTTYYDAVAVLKKYGLLGKTPVSVRKVFTDGLTGDIPETPKQAGTMFERVENVIIGSNRIALEAAKAEAERAGFVARILSSEVSGEVGEAAQRLARVVKKVKEEKEGGAKAICLISGGETTVTVTGNGEGGRNMEFAMRFALEIQGIPGITLLSAGTDGTDGPTDAAGATVDGSTIRSALGFGINPDEYLANNDSYNFFRKAGGIFVTGPTGTNVMDIQIVLVE